MSFNFKVVFEGCFSILCPQKARDFMLKSMVIVNLFYNLQK